jgi:hypothetical protein
MNTPIHHPFLNVPGSIGQFQLLEDGRQAYVSWGRSQPNQERYAGEVCRKNGDVAVFLGTENNNDYFMHILGGEIPDDATAIDLDQEEFVHDSEASEDYELEESEDEYDRQTQKNSDQRFNQFERHILAV